MTKGSTDGEGSVSTDAVVSAIAHEQRRAVLRVLDGSEGNTVDLETLAEQVATRVRAGDVDVPADDHRRRVRTALYHNHLPKLQTCGMIDHDTDTGEVRDTSDGLGRELLTAVESHDPSQ